MTTAPGPVTRPARWLVLTGGVLLVAVVVGLAVGSRGLSPVQVVAVLAGGGDAEARAVLLELRLPRTVVGAAGGAALAVAGAIMQGHTRNPLADPGLLGVGAGASVAVVLAVSLLGLSEPSSFLWFAFAGAAVAAAVVTALGLLAAGRRDSSPATLVLAGAAVSAALSAVTGVVLLLDSAALDVHRFWTVGSLSVVRGYDVLLSVAPFLLLGLVVAIAHASTLDALALGDDVARALGRRLAPARLTGLGAVTLLVGGAVVCCGSLGFVGLVVPHVVRRFTGPSHRLLLPQCAVLGAVAVVLADVVGRLVVHPAELPVGIVLGIVGAPAFLVLVVRTARGRAS